MAIGLRNTLLAAVPLSIPVLSRPIAISSMPFLFLFLFLQTYATKMPFEMKAQKREILSKIARSRRDLYKTRKS